MIHKLMRKERATLMLITFMPDVEFVKVLITILMIAQGPKPKE
jgi:hypothetical protein